MDDQFIQSEPMLCLVLAPAGDEKDLWEYAKGEEELVHALQLERVHVIPKKIFHEQLLTLSFSVNA